MAPISSSLILPWWTLLPLIVLAAGGVLMWLAWRGRRIDDHRLCRRCRYDLIGSPEASACPECGADLMRRRAVRIGNRRWSPGLLLAAGALLLIGVGGAGVTVTQLDVDWQRLKPVWLLRREAQRHGSPAARRALDELNLRLRGNALSQAQVDAVVAEALAVQSNAALPWDTRWGDLVERARAAGRVSDADFERYVLTAAAARLTLDLRPRVRRGDPLPYRLTESPARLGEQAGLYVTDAYTQITIAGHAVELGSSGSGSLNATGGGSTSSSVNVHRMPALADLPLGVHAVQMRVHVTVSEQYDGPAIAEGDAVLHSNFELVDADHETATPFVDPALRQAVRDALSVKALEVRETGQGRRYLNVGLEIKPRQVSVAFDVLARDAAGRTWAFSGIDQPAGANTTHHTSAWEVEGFDASVVEIVLQPSRNEATRSVDVFQYWGEAIVLPGVAVDWSKVPEDRRPVQSPP